jgi:hypothetical protein
MIALVLLWVGAVLVLNGLWLLGRIGEREIAVINLVTAGIGAVMALGAALRPGATVTGEIAFGAFVLLFAVTYLWVAVNRLCGFDGRGLGWYCLFVAITAGPVGLELLAQARQPWGYWLALNWLAWCLLWLLYFLLLVPRRLDTRLVGWVTVLEGVLTAWLPAYLLLMGHLPLQPS